MLSVVVSNFADFAGAAALTDLAAIFFLAAGFFATVFFVIPIILPHL